MSKKTFLLKSMSAISLLGALTVLVFCFDSLKSITDLTDQSTSKKLHKQIEDQVVAAFEDAYRHFSVMSNNDVYTALSRSKVKIFFNETLPNMKYFDYFLLTRETGEIYSTVSILRDGTSFKADKDISSNFKWFKEVTSNQFTANTTTGLNGVKISPIVNDYYHKNQKGHYFSVPIFKDGELNKVVVGFFNINSLFKAITKQNALIGSKITFSINQDFEKDKREKNFIEQYLPKDIIFTSTITNELLKSFNFKIKSNIQVTDKKNSIIGIFSQLILSVALFILGIVFWMFPTEAVDIELVEDFHTIERFNPEIEKVQNISKKAILGLQGVHKHCNRLEKKSLVYKFIEQKNEELEDMVISNCRIMIQKNDNALDKVKKMQDLSEQTQNTIKDSVIDFAHFHKEYTYIHEVKKSISIEILNMKLMLERQEVDPQISPFVKNISHQLERLNDIESKMNFHYSKVCDSFESLINDQLIHYRNNTKMFVTSSKEANLKLNDLFDKIQMFTKSIDKNVNYTKELIENCATELRSFPNEQDVEKTLTQIVDFCNSYQTIHNSLHGEKKEETIGTKQQAS